MNPAHFQQLEIRDRDDLKLPPIRTILNARPEPPPILTPALYYGHQGYTSSSASPSPRTAYCDSNSSMSRRSSISTAQPPGPVASGSRRRSTKRSHAAHDSGSDPEPKRSAGNIVAGQRSGYCDECRATVVECEHIAQARKSHAKTQHEKDSRSRQSGALQTMEDTLYAGFEFEVPLKQTKSNSERSGLRGDKQQVLDATALTVGSLTQELFEIYYAQGGSDAVNAFQKRHRDKLAAGLREADMRVLPRESWMASDSATGDDDPFDTEIRGFQDGVRKRDILAEIQQRRDRRDLRYKRNSQRRAKEIDARASPYQKPSKSSETRGLSSKLS